MKKLILFAAILFAGVSVVKADEPVTTTTAATTKDKTTFNLNLYPIQSIMVNTAHISVEMNYKTVDDYVNGVTDVEMADHLTVFSVGGFKVSVNSEADNLENSTTSSKISASSIKLNVANGTTNPFTANYEADVALTKAPQQLFSSTTGTINSSFNVTFKGLGGNDFAKPEYFQLNGNPTVHTTTVTYEITAL